jgi:hypothetical protein
MALFMSFYFNFKLASPVSDRLALLADASFYLAKMAMHALHKSSETISITTRCDLHRSSISHREIVSPFTVTPAKPSIDSLYVLNLHQAQTWKN